MKLERHRANPLITPRDVTPSRPDFEVMCAFNCGVSTLNDEVILLLRVAERPIQTAAEKSRWVLCPHIAPDGEMVVEKIRRDDPAYDTSDARIIFRRGTSEALLTSISHLRLARSHDGVNFSIADQPWLKAEYPYENFGIEDPRITRIEDRYYVNFSAVGELGISTGLVSTKNFIDCERHGVTVHLLPPTHAADDRRTEYVGRHVARSGSLGSTPRSVQRQYNRLGSGPSRGWCATHQNRSGVALDLSRG
jgi:beta-1,2-mannobiose phosphorylase / 1,2-beta-oligomannan phosphorylase